jgi:hypothetical protein
MEVRKLTKLLEAQRSAAESTESGVSAQRERNYRYYTLQPLGNEVEGRSHYISPDVLDVVETKKAYFSEVFFSGRKIFRFMADEQTSQDEAHKRTAYVERQLARGGGFERLLLDGWHDAFVAKRMVVLVEWEEDEEAVVQTYASPVPLQQLHESLMKDGSILDVDVSQLQVSQPPAQQGMPVPAPPMGGMQPSPPTPMVSGQLTIKRDRSGVALKLIQPECYYRDQNRAYVHEGTFAGFWEEVPRAELEMRGFDRELVARLKTETSSGRRSSEDSARTAHDTSRGRPGMQRVANKDLGTVIVHRTWTILRPSDYPELFADVDEPDKPAIYEIHWSGNEILEKNGTPCVYYAHEMPFFEWTEMKISHAANGMAAADIVAHTQRAQSALKRLSIDNQAMRNTSRVEAERNAIINPRELLENNIGGVVWTKKLGSIKPLDAPELSPLTLPIMEMLARDKEERSGVSRLAQGLNSDAVSKQNAADMIERLTNNSNRRIMMAARRFANDWLVPVVKYVYRLGVRNDSSVHMVNVGGNMVPVMPSLWPDIDLTARVAMALTPEEAQREAQQLLILGGAIAQDPVASSLYGLKERHSLYSRVLEALGVEDVSSILMRPDSPAFKQYQQQLAQVNQAKLMEQQQATQFARQLAQSQEMREWQRIKVDQGRLMLDTTDKAADNLRSDEQLDADIAQGWAKLAQDRDDKQEARRLARTPSNRRRESNA